MDHPKRRLSTRRRPAGFTFVEVMVSLVIVTAVTVGFYQMLLSQAEVAADNAIEISDQYNLRALNESIASELDKAKLVAIDAQAMWIKYRVMQTGVSGLPKIDQNGDPIFGCYYGGVFYSGGYNLMKWANGRADGYEPERDVITERKLATLQNPNGTDLNGDNDFEDKFTYGHIELFAYDVLNDRVFGPKFLPGLCLTETAVTGGVFYLRRQHSKFSVLGGDVTRPTLIKSFQRADDVTDSNNNSIWDFDTSKGRYESYTDVNGNGKYEGPDSDPFGDNKVLPNGVLDGEEQPADQNKPFYCAVRVQLMTVNSGALLKDNTEIRHQFTKIKTYQTKVRIKYFDK